MTNPAALALALLLGHEARINEEQWSEVRAMECPNCKEMDWSNLPDGSYTCSACHQTYYLRTSGVKTALPQVTHHCPNCEAAARERDAMHKGWSEATLRECKLSDELADLRARLARVRRLLDQVAEFQSFTMPEFEQARALLAEKEAK